jgi:hypothetical protein
MVRWSSRFSLRASGTRNRLSGNGLPGHTTGVFPIQSSDPAYRYDRNPNSIRSYTLAVSLPRNPRRARRIGGGGAPSEGGPPDGGSPR